MSGDERSAWDSNAAAWDRHLNEGRDPNHEDILLPAIDALIGEIGRRRVLDLGCGEGHLSRFLADRGALVSGLDFSQSMIEIARRRSESYSIDFRVGDADEVDSIYRESELFDVCVANMSLFCIDDIRLVLTKLRKVLTGSGILVFSILHPCFPLRIYQTSTRTVVDSAFNNPERIEWPSESYFNRRMKYRRLSDDFPAETRIHVRMIEEYAAALHEAGYVIENIAEPRPPRAVIEDRAHLSHDLYPLFPFFLVVRAAVSSQQTSVATVKQQLANFRTVRDWQKFQTPKNNAISVVLEAAELLTHFQWLNTEDDTRKYIAENRSSITDELADVYLNLLLLADDLGVDLDSTALDKLKKLHRKYPRSSTYGRAVTPADKGRTTRDG